MSSSVIWKVYLSGCAIALGEAGWTSTRSVMRTVVPARVQEPMERP